MGSASLYSDSLETDWRLGEVSRVAVDLTANESAFEGQHVMALESTGTQDWQIEMVRKEPLNVAGYGSLHLALRFDEVTVRNPAWLLLLVNDRPRLSLLAADRAGGVMLDQSGWQVVEIPFDEIPLRPSYIESLRLWGRFSGRLYVDDVRVVPNASTLVGDLSSAMPVAARLLPGYPNPFNGQTSIRFVLPVDGFVELTIYNLLGQPVVTLVRVILRAGTHNVRWHRARTTAANRWPAASTWLAFRPRGMQRHESCCSCSDRRIVSSRYRLAGH